MSLHPVVDERSQTIIGQLNCPAFNELLLDAIELMKPSSLYIQTSSKEEIDYARSNALAQGEEYQLAIPGHTYHFDSPDDQGRDKKNTLILLDDQSGLDAGVMTRDRKEGTAHIREIMNGCMEGKQMLVAFYCLGPVGCSFSKTAVQFTDSWYILHSENILYRNGFTQMVNRHTKETSANRSFYAFYHSVGRTDNAHRPIDIDKRRIYINPVERLVYTINNSYAGNALACKKLALRLAIYDSNHHPERNNLTEHMFLSTFANPCIPSDKLNVCGAFPSACGKTSTSMAPGSSIIGDDMVYMQIVDDNMGIRRCKAVNIEAGMFGIIAGVNSSDDPLIYDCLTSERECIFSNVLVGDDGKPYWDGMYHGKSKNDMVNEFGLLPSTGQNYKGAWTKPELPIMHGNARFTLSLKELKNVSPELDNPDGVDVDLILYGGRDSNTCPPVYQAHNWAHGVYIGSSIESETTAATLGAQGVVVSNPMANLDFLIIPVPMYLENHVRFGRLLGSRAPKVFGVNYFLKDPSTGEYLNSKLDKKVWVAWACGRTRGHYRAKCTPIGWIPYYEDLQTLFRSELGVDYTEEQYNVQFTINVDNYIQKMVRIMKLYGGKQAPTEWVIMECRVLRALKKLLAEKGPAVSPSAFDNYESQSWFDKAFTEE